MYKSLLVVSLLLTACGDKLNFGSGSDPGTRVEYYMVDGVKNIRSDVDDSLKAETYREDFYSITPESRLLLRFENLASHTGKIVVADSDQVWIRIVVSDRSNLDQALVTMRLCPMMKNWMMMATWWYAHPFSRSGNWSRQGGDYDVSACVQAVIDPGKKLPSETTLMDQRALYFNITRWYRDVFKGVGGNLGHILVSEGVGVVEILGDNSLSYAPRIQWSEAATL